MSMRVATPGKSSAGAPKSITKKARAKSPMARQSMSVSAVNVNVLERESWVCSRVFFPIALWCGVVSGVQGNGLLWCIILIDYPYTDHICMGRWVSAWANFSRGMAILWEPSPTTLPGLTRT